MEIYLSIRASAGDLIWCEFQQLLSWALSRWPAAGVLPPLPSRRPRSLPQTWPLSRPQPATPTSVPTPPPAQTPAPGSSPPVRPPTIAPVVEASDTTEPTQAERLTERVEDALDLASRGNWREAWDYYTLSFRESCPRETFAAQAAFGMNLFRGMLEIPLNEPLEFRLMSVTVEGATAVPWLGWLGITWLRGWSRKSRQQSVRQRLLRVVPLVPV